MSYFFIYLLNIILLILYVTTIATTGTFFFVEKKSSYKPILFFLIIYFINFFCDDILMSMIETFNSFEHYFAEEFGGVPFTKIIFYLINNVCMVNILALVCNQKTKAKDYLIIVTITILMVIIPFLPISKLHVFLFYFPNEVFFMYIGVKLYQALKQDKVTPQYRKIAKIIVYLNMIFGSLIILEDIFIIFFVDHYNTANSVITYRNYSESLFLIIVSFLTVRYSASIYNQHQTPEPLTAVPLAEDSLSDDKFAKFCLEYRLTERESEILAHLLSKKSNQAIADELYLSIGTVKSHIHNIYSKMNISKRKELFTIFENFH
ncbi:transcriptional regulator, LuxR family [Granulicatella balaenopterae]|uniref:Transcriptional regulator, LuxR family n=1 Tax=Granulicatella balaenopterae TaxID=137733 RepID=A0A1H9PD19_9LACT|nr:LuxR C-terminal-related transcriptional regulator [Granulicatella balaenopterae]SER46057.1 transcriptional regulator, LuxR family [Granulicatella balaenopterae]